MTDERKELADIARAARRYLERERAAGRGELLAEAVSKVEKSMSNESSEGNERGFPSASSRAGRMPAPSGREELPVRPEPFSAGSRTNLFGEEEAAPTPTPAAAAREELGPPATASSALSVFDDDLNPGGLCERQSLADAAVPILDQVAAEVRGCTLCGLCETRTKAVPGVGTARSGIVFVGEAPGADEDRLGEPFVGRAGQLLDKIIKAMDEAKLIPGMPLDRTTVYICNVLKCRPPENRNPLPHEIETCSPYLRRQLAAIQPRIICCLGKFAAELLVGAKGTIGGMRGKVHHYQGAKLIVTYHPAYCLRNPEAKRPVWEDMHLLAREYLSD